MIALRKFLKLLPGHYSAMVLLSMGGLFLTPTASGAAREPVRGLGGMVVSAHSLASQAGLDMLKRGGTAMDAAVTVGLALAVVHPSAGNLGGGGFMLVCQVLKAKGHSLRVKGYLGSAMGILIDPGTGLRFGAADPRQADGAVAAE